ncbi:ROK family protein [Sphingomonas sp. 2R-10]|uniref:ROK family protein n=1 Tax=Sphingomonas sp. 2R-10 TaxID=3045148 RepID=UPI0019D0F071|nr:ROK family protein [Sphingomonas sp. 2R-10]MDJ0278045.1 ROK family protein [Sphingomonas sp. 2R-10]
MKPRPAFQLHDEQKRIIWNLRIGGPVPRTALAARLGIHNGAMTRISRELLTLGLVREAGANEPGPRGRPTIPLELDPGGCYAVGATLHPGWMEVVLVDFAGRPIGRHIEDFDSPDPRLFATVLRNRIAVLESRSEIRRARFLGIGIAATGPSTIDGPGHRMAVSRLRGWRDVDLPELFSAELGEAVWVENDATLAALAEFYDGDLASATRSALVVSIGHGVAAGAILNRDLFRGDHGNAGEIGLVFPMDGPRPSGIDLLAALQAAGEDIQSLADIDQCLDRQAPLIDTWCTRAADQLHPVLVAGAAWLDPETIVISGALPLAVLDTLTDRLGRHPMPHHLSVASPSLRTSRLGSAAVAIGAALLPIHALTAR